MNSSWKNHWKVEGWKSRSNLLPCNSVIPSRRCTWKQMSTSRTKSYSFEVHKATFSRMESKRAQYAPVLLKWTRVMFQSSEQRLSLKLIVSHSYRWDYRHDGMNYMEDVKEKERPPIILSIFSSVQHHGTINFWCVLQTVTDAHSDTIKGWCC